MIKGLELPMDVADNIAIACLKEHLGYLQGEQEQFTKFVEQKGQLESHHESDWMTNNKMIYHITAVLKYYGVDV